MNKYRPQVQFYADNLLFRNKLYTFRVNNLKDAHSCIERHTKKGWNVRAAFYREFNAIGQIRSNNRIK